MVLRVLQIVVVGAVALFLLAPVVLVFVLSFSNEAFVSFPPDAWGLRQYETMVDSDVWTTPLVRSIAIAAVTTVLVIAIGVPAVLAAARSRLRGRHIVGAVAIGPLLVPGVVLAIGVYQTFVDLDLAGTMLGFVIVHCMLALPFVMLIVGAAITRVPQELELAAMSLGASRLRAYRDVTLPLLWPAVAAAALFTFSLSLNEVTISSFIAGIDFTTLPVAIFSSLRFSVEPVIMAIASSLAILSGILLTAVALLRRRLA